MAEIRVRVIARARRPGFAGERGGALVARVVEPATEGRANEALRKLVAKRAGVSKSRVEIVRGARSRDKVVRVEGVGASALRRALTGQ